MDAKPSESNHDGIVRGSGTWITRGIESLGTFFRPLYFTQRYRRTRAMPGADPARGTQPDAGGAGFGSGFAVGAGIVLGTGTGAGTGDGDGAGTGTGAGTGAGSGAGAGSSGS